MTCWECGLQGHNKRYHLRPGASGSDWFDAQLDPMENDMESTLNSRNKPQDTNSVYHFMPTPGVDLHGQRDGPSASSLPVLRGHDKGKAVVDDIRMEEIDISPMVEDLERLNAEEAATTRKPN
ncbi:hypothetical protein Adt_19039 [Abeliophyllum distichum]|uniref:Uncharacterized protein n=1 Tax=Abeliophyllum distichum TaxID=126358 RepID=A0ABD1TL40_9LAMI